MKLKTKSCYKSTNSHIVDLYQYISMNGLHKYTEEVSHAINIFEVGFKRLLCNTCSKLDCIFFNQLLLVIGKILRCKNKLMQKQTTKTPAPSINSWTNFRRVNKKNKPSGRTTLFSNHLSTIFIIRFISVHKTLSGATLAAGCDPGSAHAPAQTESVEFFQELFPNFE